MQTLLTERQVAAILQIQPKTLRNWRDPKINKGPAWFKLGRLVRYDRQDVQLWMAHQAVQEADRQFSRALGREWRETLLMIPQ
jgi:predicted DNA-binding transcriptional regulator AlpA